MWIRKFAFLVFDYKLLYCILKASKEDPAKEEDKYKSKMHHQHVKDYREIIKPARWGDCENICSPELMLKLYSGHSSILGRLGPKVQRSQIAKDKYCGKSTGDVGAHPLTIMKTGRCIVWRNKQVVQKHNRWSHILLCMYWYILVTQWHTSHSCYPQTPKFPS